MNRSAAKVVLTETDKEHEEYQTDGASERQTRHARRGEDIVVELGDIAHNGWS